MSKNVSTVRPVDRVAGIVLHQGNVLLMFRKNHGKEYYIFPGGGIDEGESNEDALIREMHEETSIVVVPKKLVYVVDWDKETKQFFYLCSYVSGVPILGDFIEKETMQSDENQYYEPLWKATTEINKLLMYPLEIRDLMTEDFESDFTEPQKNVYLSIATCRQEI